jgi:hypothetical protein
LEGYLDYHNHFVYVRQFLCSPWGYGLSLPGPDDGLSFALGPLHLAALAAAPIIVWRTRKASCPPLSRMPSRSLVSFFVVLSLGAAFLASRASVWLWERLPLLHPLQFPWRALSLIAPATAFLCGAPFLLTRERGSRPRLEVGAGLVPVPEDAHEGTPLPPVNAQRPITRPASALMWAMLAFTFLLGFPRAAPQGYLHIDESDYRPASIAARGIEATARQFEPIWVQERPPAPASAPVTLFRGQGRVLSSRPSPTAIEIHAQITADARLQVNTFYFPGWTLTVDGVERPVEVSSPHGLIEFDLERGEHHVQVRFRDTPIRRWSTGCSLLSLLLLLLFPLFRRAER